MNLKAPLFALLAFLLLSCQQEPTAPSTPYLQNRAPLSEKPYLELPLGSIRPEGWLLMQMERMRDGMTGHLDEWYPEVVGERNGWLGGDGDGWERGVYWLDGLLPLAWQLDDDQLKAKVQPWIEWSIGHQREDGYFGPLPFDQAPPTEPGLQKTKRRDWWPKMVMLKVLQQYYEASADERVIDLMLNYFRYQLRLLPEYPLDHWSFWANRRAGDNLMVVLWLYNLTGEDFLLKLGDLLYEQSFPWTEVFLNSEWYTGADISHLYPHNTRNTYPFDPQLISRLHSGQLQSFHGVNLAQGIKQPAIRYLQDPDSSYLRAVEKAFRDILHYHGLPQGMYGGDEAMHGKMPTQGVELCSVVELMYSLEKMIAITGDLRYMDHLEKIAYNALPTQISDDFSTRQYFQQVNQVMLTRHRRNFYVEDHHGHTDLCFGLLTGYPCCTCNLHQGWPKLLSHMWYATRDGGLAAVIYGPCELRALVRDGVEVGIREKTDYPFRDRIRLHLSLEESTRFPLHLRIPGWCKNPVIQVNGEEASFREQKGMAILDQNWSPGDVVEIRFPMGIRLSRWQENAVAVERGPLLYALKVREDWALVEGTDKYGDYYEVRPRDPWNYGLLQSLLEDPDQGFEVVEMDREGRYPWNLENAPLQLRTKAKRIPDWSLYREMAGPLPHSLPAAHLMEEEAEDILLLPYGCTTLRIAEFPVLR